MPRLSCSFLLAALLALATMPVMAEPSFRDCPDCPEMIQLEPGRFVMGSPATETERDPTEGPQHEVVIGYGFAVGHFPVTFDQWDACVAAGGCNGHRPSDHGWGRADRPVINVSWSDAQAYVQWLSSRTGKRYRLLSEAEYEYAARAGTTTARYWGDEVGKRQAACGGCGSAWDKVKTAPVGNFPPNPWGLQDMLGNVWSWTQDCWSDDYAKAPADGSPRPPAACPQHPLRGGSWFRNYWNARAASRVSAATADRGVTIGFRVARDLP